MRQRQSLPDDGATGIWSPRVDCLLHHAVVCSPDVVLDQPLPPGVLQCEICRRQFYFLLPADVLSLKRCRDPTYPWRRPGSHRVAHRLTSARTHPNSTAYALRRYTTRGFEPD